MICQQTSTGIKANNFILALAYGSLAIVSTIHCSKNPTGPLTVPVITTQPQPAEQTVAAGATLTFTVVASGNPAPTYQWKKDGVNDSQGTATAATLVIAHATVTDTGTYYVVVTNSIGSVTSDWVSLLVTQAPVITTQPSYEQTVTAGESVTFTVAASANPAPAYQWKYSPNDTTWAAIAGATNSSYTIGSVSAGNAGYYEVVVTNLEGTVTSATAALTVN